MQQIKIIFICFMSILGFSKEMPKSVSAFHLIVWIFGVTQGLSEINTKKIRRMYGESRQMINPVVKDKNELKNVLRSIKMSNKHCIIRIVADQKMLHIVLEISREKRAIEIYHLKPKGLIEASLGQRKYLSGFQEKKFNNFVEQQSLEQIERPAQSQMLPKPNKIVEVLYNLDEVIARAEREVEVFTKSFRTFENSQCLVGDFTRINRYRFRLISFINLKISDFDDAFTRFQRFVMQELPHLNQHLLGMKNNELTGGVLMMKLGQYYSLAQNFMKETYERAAKQVIQNDLENKQSNAKDQIQNSSGELHKQQYVDNTTYKQDFYHSVLSIYQEEGFFYHFLNSNLKVVGDQNSNWKNLSLPFTHVYNAIKFLYKKQVQQKNGFYLQETFQVFRGGRIRKSELKQYQEYAGKIFIEFFGFISTSESAKIVADKFVSFRNSKDRPYSQSIDESQQNIEDEDVIFRIKVKQNQKIHEKNYDFLLNGFFRMGKKQKQGNSEQQVLFNALNIFRLVKISEKPIIDLFSETERSSIKKQQPEKDCFKQKQQKYRINYYDRQITVIDLQFGTFYDVLFEQNNFDLSKEDKKSKQNYVYCMNKIKKYDKFDYADACELTNQLDESYKYLKTKIGFDAPQTQRFKLSKLDNKNYFQRLSTICNKLGKANEALNYTKIALQCHKQLNSIHLSSIYNSHYEKLFDMQLKCIQIYREYSNYRQAQDQLKQQLQLIRSKNFKEPKAKIKESEIYINQAINFYSIGKLDECINRFQKCSHQLKKTIQQYSLYEQRTCNFFSFLKNIFVKGPKMERTCFYSDYVKMQRENRQQQMISLYGKIQQLEQTSNLAKDLLYLANKAVQNRKIIFKSRKNYEKFICEFSHQYSLNPIDSRKKKTQKEILEDNIKKNIGKLYRQELQSQEYRKLSDKLNQQIQRIQAIETNCIETSSSESLISEFIKKFKEKENERKRRQFEDMKNLILNENKQQLIQKYISCAQFIQENINELKSEGYVENTISILHKRIEKAEIYYNCNRRQLAMKEIDFIIKSGMIEGEDRHLELANAYLTKGKIHLENEEIDQAFKSFTLSISSFQKPVNYETQEMQQENDQLQVSAVSQNLNQNLENTSKSEFKSRKNQLYHCNNYLQARIQKLKVLLIKIELLLVQQYGRSANIFERFAEVDSRQIKNSQDHMHTVQSQIGQLRTIIDNRSKLEDLGQLKCSLLEVDFQFSINLPPSQALLSYIFSKFAECIALRDGLQGKYKARNVLMCCEFILRYHKRKELLNQFLKLGYGEYLKRAETELTQCSFYWKIIKASYFLYKERNIELENHYLSLSIEILKREANQKKRQYLVDEFNNLISMGYSNNVQTMENNSPETYPNEQLSNMQLNEVSIMINSRRKNNTLSNIETSTSNSSFPHCFANNEQNRPKMRQIVVTNPEQRSNPQIEEFQSDFRAIFKRLKPKQRNLRGRYVDFNAINQEQLDQKN